MNQKHPKATTMIPEWLNEHVGTLEAESEADKILLVLIEEYERLVDTIEYWEKHSNDGDDSFYQILKSKELNFIKIIEEKIGSVVKQ
jgi:hypothetical protein